MAMQFYWLGLVGLRYGVFVSPTGAYINRSHLQLTQRLGCGSPNRVYVMI